MNKKFQAFKYILSDFISAVAAWVIFYFYRKFIIEGGGALISFPEDPKFWYGSILIPIGWVIVYAFTGTYSNIYRKSRLKEFGQTIYISILGSLVIFFCSSAG